MKQIANLTQHPATAEQVDAGVFDLPADQVAALRDALTFSAPPTHAEIHERASRIAAMVADTGAVWAMLGGAPYLMAPLEEALALRGIHPLYAFSVRESAEQKQPDGSVRKVNVFRHAGFVGDI